MVEAGDSSSSTPRRRLIRSIRYVCVTALGISIYLYFDGTNQVRPDDPVYNVVRFATWCLFQILLTADFLWRGHLGVFPLLAYSALLICAATAFFEDYRIRGVRDVSLMVENRTFPQHPEPKEPMNNCLRMTPSKFCKNRDYYAIPNPALWDQFKALKLTLLEMDMVFSSIMYVATFAFDLAQQFDVWSRPTEKERRSCVDAFAETMCNFAFVRCTGDCQPLTPCWETCEEPFCGDLPTELVSPMMTRDSDSTYFPVAEALASKAYGTCTDKKLNDGITEWTTTPTADQTAFTPECDRHSVAPLTDASFPVIPQCESGVGINEELSMMDACCSCGGGEEKGSMISPNRLNVLWDAAKQLSLVDVAFDKMTATCRAQVPGDFELLTHTCARASYYLGVGFEWAAWAVTETFSEAEAMDLRTAYDRQIRNNENILVEQPSRTGQRVTLAKCAKRCSRKPTCSAFSFMPSYGCASEFEI